MVVKAKLSPQTIIANALQKQGLFDGRTPELTENSKIVLNKRYLNKDKDGNITENDDGMFRRVAHNISLAELNYNNDEEHRRIIEQKFYHIMRELYFLPNSPTLMNAGKELQQLSACFVLPVEDSIEDIFQKIKYTALIHKSGGGTGFSFSRLRPAGDIVGSTGGVASGPVSFIKAFDAATDAIKQGGTRRGANMGVLHITHPDIMNFIHSKRDGTQLLNFNISVAVTNDFMSKVLQNQEYDLINPHTNEVVGQLNARGVFDDIVKLAWETGDPGLVFIDNVNKSHPNKHLGEIESCNPCGEQFLLAYESCNLGSINMARMTKIVDDKVVIDEDLLLDVCYIATNFLDNVIDMNKYPVESIREATEKTRRIGVGVMGVADMLIQMGIPYNSDEALFVCDSIMYKINRYCKQASEHLVRERGAYPAFLGSDYETPIRNTSPTCIAPTGTISMIAGVSSGIEPLFALSYVRNVMDQTKLVEYNPYLKCVAEHESWDKASIDKSLSEKGDLSIADVPDWAKQIFISSHNIAPMWHIKMQSAFQRHTDNAVSKTVNFPANATIDEVREVYDLAYQSQCKGVTIYRDGSKENQVLTVATNSADSAPVVRERPREMFGVTKKVQTGHGIMYVTVNHDENNRPFEVFGMLGKAGGCDAAMLEAITRMASLALRFGVDPQLIVRQLSGITCCPVWDSGVQVKSCPDAIALAINEVIESKNNNYALISTLFSQNGYHSNGHYSNGGSSLNGNHSNGGPTCLECGGKMVHEEGCAKCYICGISKC